MPSVQPDEINEIFLGVAEPFTGEALSSLIHVKKVDVSQHDLSITIDIEISFSLPSTALDSLSVLMQRTIEQAYQDYTIELHLTTVIRSHGVSSTAPVLSKVKNIIAIASGKGGVGKSTTSANIALALAQQGAKVGLLDADIYGPNQPLMMGVRQTQAETKNSKFIPVMTHGVATMSVGYLVDDDTPMVWRGPIVSKVLTQLLKDTAWPECDYLIVDLPPGTGDVQLTLSKGVAMSGAMIVTTPQTVALQDAVKAQKMFEKVGVVVLGVVENMAVHVCSQCGHEEHVFGDGGAQTLTTDATPLLGQLPLMRSIREAGDSGLPVVMQYPDSDIALRYHRIASKLSAQVALQPRQYAAHFPNITVEKN